MKKSDNGNLNESYCTSRIYIILEKPNPLWLSLFTNHWKSKWNRLVSLTEQAFVENHSNRIQSESLWNMKFYVCIILITEYIFFEFLSFKFLLHWDKTDIKHLWYFRFQQICSSKSFCFCLNDRQQKRTTSETMFHIYFFNFMNRLTNSFDDSRTM